MTIDSINFRGENNYFKNAVLNCVQVLKNFSKEHKIEIKNYYEEEVANPICPAFVVLVSGSNDELRTSQNLSQMRYTININLEIWYLHADLTEEVKRNEITYILWEVSDYLKKNVTLNGFVPKLGINVTDVRWIPHERGSRVLAGGVINVVARKLYSTRITS